MVSIDIDGAAIPPLILGDMAYPLHPCLMNPFMGHVGRR